MRTALITGATAGIGQAAALTAPPCGFFNVSAKLLAPNAEINVTFANEIRLYEWKTSSLDGHDLIAGGGVEVHRGALLYALRQDDEQRCLRTCGRTRHDCRGWRLKQISAADPKCRRQDSAQPQERGRTYSVILKSPGIS